jgi:hypothetical protein
MIQSAATLTCPHCGHRDTQVMPSNACVFFWICPGCGDTLRPRPGDCCVFCSYSDVPCPPVQAAGGRPGACCG